MPLGEAILYLKHSVKRRFGPDVTVRFLDITSRAAQGASWKDEGPLPLIIIDGDVVFKGDLSVRQIVQELNSRKNKGEKL